VFAICDNQAEGNKALIEAQVELLLMHEEKGFENLVLNSTTEGTLRRFAALIDWPQHLKDKYPDVDANVVEALREYFAGSKANWGIADLLVQCSVEEIPAWLREACLKLKEKCAAAPATAAGAEAAAGDAGHAAH
jgi:putative ATP-dependent endonuclease of the OLD family